MPPLSFRGPGNESSFCFQLFRVKWHNIVMFAYKVHLILRNERCILRFKTAGACWRSWGSWTCLVQNLRYSGKLVSTVRYAHPAITHLLSFSFEWKQTLIMSRRPLTSHNSNVYRGHLNQGYGPTVFKSKHWWTIDMWFTAWGSLLCSSIKPYSFVGNICTNGPATFMLRKGPISFICAIR